MRSLIGRNKDYYGGALMILIGLAALIGATKYRLGTLEEIGPGLFPGAVGAILAAVGLVIALGAGAAAAHEEYERLRPEWRGWGCIIGGAAAFVVLGTYGGLVLATFAIVFVTALGDRNNTVRQSFSLALGMVVVSVILFHWALQLQLPLFTWG